MKKLLVTGLAFLTLSAHADEAVVIPHEFTAGTPAKAAEVNANFTALGNAANSVKSDVAQNSSDIASLQADVNELRQTLEAPEVQMVPFLFRMNAGDEKVIVEKGTLKLVASCELVVPDEGEEEGPTLRVLAEEEASEDYRVSIYGRSSSTGDVVYSDDDSGYMETDEEYYFIEDSDDGIEVDVEIDQGAMVGKDGTVILLDGETTLYGLNVQGTNCLLAGSATVFTGAAAAEFEVPVSDDSER